MGLDQYLSAKNYISRFDFNTDTLDLSPEFVDVVEKLNIKHYDRSGHAGITIEIPMAYWRKANQIHNWFVKNVQDGEDNCASYFVSRDQLQNLLDTVKMVIADNTLAEKLLPSASGFFFGSTEYDEWYFADLRNTVLQLQTCLDSPYEYFEYQSSW